MKKRVFLLLTVCVALLTSCYKAHVDISEQDLLKDTHSLVGKSQAEVRDYYSNHGFARITSGDHDTFTGSTHDEKCHITLSPTYANECMQGYDLEICWKESGNMVSAVNLALDWEQYAFAAIFPQCSWEANFNHGGDEKHYTAAERSTFRSDVGGFIEEDHLDVHYKQAEANTCGNLTVSTMRANQVLQTNVRFVYSATK